MNKRALFLAIATLVSSHIMAQVNQLFPTFGKTTGSFTQTETGSVTVFEVKGTEKQITELQKNAANISKSGNLSVEKKENGIYSVTLNVTVQNHPEYVHKMFLHLGFEYFIYDGKKRAIAELPSVLKSLK